MSIGKIESPRELRGLAILSMGDSITHVKKGVYRVKSQTGIGEYEVRTHQKYGQDRAKHTCTCPDYEKNHADCKHIFAVKFSKKLRKDVEAEHEKDSVEEITVRPDNCPMCHGENVILRGKRKTKNGEIQRYYCKGCNHRFTIDRGFSRMKSEPKAVTLSMDLYFKGISYRKICDHLRQFYSLNVNQTTPMRWIRKYMKLLAQYSEKYKADVGKIWHSDEMTVFIKKHGEKRYYEWLWNVMDAKTRFLLACKITKTRDVDDAVKPLHEAKNRADKRPDVIVTDGLRAYEDAIPSEFYDICANVQNPHLRLKDFETKPNNNILERLNGTVRERTKVMRSLSTNDGADLYADGMRVFYNYLRPHQALNGLTPSQVAGIPIDLSGNRWLTMIELAHRSKSPDKQRTEKCN